MSNKPRQMLAATSTDRSPYRGYRFPPEIIAHAAWLYFRFHLSFRDVQDLLADRGVIVSHEAIRQCCTKFGAVFAGRYLGDKNGLATSGTLTSAAEDLRKTSLAVAGGRSEWRRAGHPGAVAA